MKLYQKILFIAAVLIAVLVAQDLSWKILGEPAEPLEIAAGSDDFVTARKIGGKYSLSFWNEKGARLKTVKIPIGDGKRTVGLDFADDKYCLWNTNDEFRITAYVAERENGLISSVVGEFDGEILGTQAVEERLYFVTLNELEENCAFRVYRAENDASEFVRVGDKRYDFYCGEKIAPRKAVYLPEAALLVVLDSAGGVRLISADGSRTVIGGGAERICCNEKGYVFVKMSDGGVFYIDPLNDRQKELFREPEISGCTKLSVFGELRSAVLFRNNDDRVTAAVYANGRVTLLTKLQRHSILLYLPLFVPITAAVMLLELLAAGCVCYAAQRRIPLTRRITAACVMTAAVVLESISMIIYSSYNSQKEDQQWNRLTVSLNNISVFLKSGEQARFADKLKALSGKANAFCPNADGRYVAVFQRPENNGLTPIQIYGRAVAERISELENGNESTVKYEFRDNGKRYIALAGAVDAPDGKRAVISVSMPFNSSVDFQVIFASALLFIVFTLFLLVLLIRIRRALLPLAVMERRIDDFCREPSAKPVKPVGHNEITMLTKRFNEAVSDLSGSIKKSEKSAAAYRRFVSKDITALMGGENLSEIHAGDFCEKMLVILYADFRQKNPSENTEREFMRLNELYKRVIPVITANGGMIQWESASSFKALFYKREFEAVCAAVTVRELSADDFDTRLIIDRGKTVLRAYGTQEHTCLSAELSENRERIALMKEVIAAFGVEIIVSGEASESVPRFSETFNHRMLGVFHTKKNDETPITIYEISAQKCKDSFDKAVNAFMSGNYSEAFSMFFEIVGRNAADSAAVKYLYLCDEMLRRQHCTEE